MTAEMSSSSPVISVIMSVYNGQPYLNTAVQSIRNQTFEDFEFIIIDDGSRDNTRNILEEHADHDTRIRLVRQENHGLIYSLNRGLRMAQGEYVARMDADDISHPRRFKRQTRFLNENPEVGIVGTHVEVINGRGKSVDHWAPPSEQGLIAWRLMFNACLVHPSIMARRSLLEELGGYAEWPVHSEDYELWGRAIQVTRLTTIPNTLLKFRLSEESVSAANRQKQMETNCKIAAELHNDLLGSSGDDKIAHFLIWMRQCGMERALDEVEINDFTEVHRYVRALHRAHRGRFCYGGSTIRVRREVLPLLDRIAEQISEQSGWRKGILYKLRARFMRPIHESIPWLWRAVRDRLSGTNPVAK